MGVNIEKNKDNKKLRNPKSNKITQRKYKRYRHENFSQQVMRRVPTIPNTANPIKTPKKAVTAKVTIFMMLEIESSMLEMLVSKPLTKSVI